LVNEAARSVAMVASTGRGRREETINKRSGGARTMGVTGNDRT